MSKKGLYRRVMRYSGILTSVCICAAILLASVCMGDGDVSLLLEGTADRLGDFFTYESFREGTSINAASPRTGILTAATFDDSGSWSAVSVADKSYTGDAVMHEGKIYVQASHFADFCTDVPLTHNDDGMTVSISSDTLSLSATVGDRYICANGRYLWCESGIISDGGAVFVPVDMMTAAIGGVLSYESNGTVGVTLSDTPITDGSDYYDGNEVLWLSRIINAESRGEPLEGKIAVGNVVLNRAASGRYPDTVYGVIFDTRGGVQFTPASTGTIMNEPSDESVIAAKLCLEGVSMSDEILFFVNEETATDTWVMDNCTYAFAVGGHSFYS